MNWKCPECDHYNDEEIIRCICGYERIEYEDESRSLSEDNAHSVFISPYKPDRFLQILHEQIDDPPHSWQALLYMFSDISKAWLYNLMGSSPVCGIVEKDHFELRNRSDSAWSAIVYGKVQNYKSGSKMFVWISKKFWWFDFLRRCTYGISQTKDLEIIFDFLKKHLKLEEVCQHENSEAPSSRAAD